MTVPGRDGGNGAVVAPMFGPDACIGALAIELRESVRRIGAEGMEDLAARMVEAARASDFAEVEVLLTHMGMELDWLLRILDENRCSGNL